MMFQSSSRTEYPIVPSKAYTMCTTKAVTQVRVAGDAMNRSRGSSSVAAFAFSAAFLAACPEPIAPGTSTTTSFVSAASAAVSAMASPNALRRTASSKKTREPSETPIADWLREGKCRGKCGGVDVSR
jgi:hypothetical protein